LLGATGTIGQATLHALLKQGHQVVCFGRASSQVHPKLAGVIYRMGDVSDPASLARDGFQGEAFDAVVSCMASRTGAPRDAWAIDHQAQCHVLQAAQAAGVTHFVLLSAICVQKPKLAFQHAKLAFEQALINSGMRYSIVRPTAFFKSLSGQIERLRQGKPFLLFGNGELTACKPISDDDLGDYLAGCLSDHQRHNQVLPIGGPGPAITPLQQGHMLFELMGKPPKFKRVPVGLLDGIIAVLSTLGHVVPPLANKAELARIGRYYATESMLVFNPNTERYDEASTPSHGLMTLRAHYAALIAQDQSVNLGDHAVF
jgi:divinyl chlorophyllide a 8-vinyl-reductase